MATAALTVPLQAAAVKGLTPSTTALLVSAVAFLSREAAELAVLCAAGAGRSEPTRHDFAKALCAAYVVHVHNVRALCDHAMRVDGPGPDFPHAVSSPAVAEGMLRHACDVERMLRRGWSAEAALDALNAHHAEGLTKRADGGELELELDPEDEREQEDEDDTVFTKDILADVEVLVTSFYDFLPEPGLEQRVFILLRSVYEDTFSATPACGTRT